MVASFYKKRSSKSYFGSMSRKKKVFSKKKYSKYSKAKPKLTIPKVRAIVDRQIKKDIETKLNPLSTVYAASPLSQDTSLNIIYYNNYCLGQPANTWLGPTGTGNFVGLNGFTFPQGTGNSDRIGKYMNLMHTSLQFRIGLIGIPRVSSPIRFRILVYKAKRNASLGTSGGNPNTTLFLDQTGESVGINQVYTSSSVAYELMNRLPNKRNFEFLMDKQIVMSHPLYSVTGSSSIVTPQTQGNLTNEHNFLLKLNHKDLQSSFNAADEPDDLRFQWCITVLSAPTGNLTNTGYNDWRTYVRGVTTAKDA